MKIDNTISGVQASIRVARKQGKSVAFVPTMGNLHDGHLALIRLAKQRADFVVCSIFVNPTQFGPNEDFDRYPRTLNRDVDLLDQSGCDLVFAPDTNEMYANGRSQSTSVQISGISDILCGASRPGHFDGVATVVSKLFNIIQPDLAIFGSKDYQQVAVIRTVVKELCFPVTILAAPTVRDADGLAMSSRNQYLTPAERLIAPMLYQQLQLIAQQFSNAPRDLAQIIQSARNALTEAGFVVDYLTIRSTLLGPFEPGMKEAVVLVAAKLGNTRLIDNLSFAVNAS